METKRLFDFLTEKVQEVPNQQFLASKVQGQWKHYTYREVQHEADKLSQLLLNLGLKPDDKIAIIAANRPEWNFTDIGAQQIGVIAVPMYPTISLKDYEYIFRDAGIRFAFVGDKAVYDKVKPLLTQVETLKGIYTFDDIAGTDNYSKSLPALAK